MVLKKQAWFFGLIFLVILLAIYFRASSFSLDKSEENVIQSLSQSIPTIDGKTVSFAALNSARISLGSPFLADLSVLINKIFEGNIFALRFPGFLAFLGSLYIFYLLGNYLRLKKIIFYPLILIVSFVLFLFSLRISPFIYFSFFILLLFFLGLRFFQEEETNFWQVFGLTVSFLILPTIHYLSLIFILCLDLIFIVIILTKPNKLVKIGYLLFLNLYLVIPLSVWADVYLRYFKY